MRSVEIYINESIGSMFLAWSEEAMMRCAWRGEMDLPEDDQQALDVIFSVFNDDQRPEGYQDRSLSVADVVTLDGSRSWAVAGVGFKEIGLLTGQALQNPEQWNELNPQLKQGVSWPTLMS